MNRVFLITIVAVGLVVIAVGGWAVDGVRWAAGDGRGRRALRYA